MTTVTHVTTAHRPTDNRILRKECVALREAGIDVTLVAVAPSDSVVEGVPLVALPSRGSRLARMLLGPLDVWAVLRRLRPRVIHVHDPELIPLAILWRTVGHGRAVYDSHEDLPKQVMGKPYLARPVRPMVALFAKALERAADRFLDGIVAATPAIARNYRSDQLALVQNFPWARDFASPVPFSRATPGQAVYVGGVSRERGGLEMVEAARRSRHGAHLVVAGPASTEMETVMRRCDDHVRYRGVLPVADIPSVVAAGQVGLVLFHPLPNHMECQPTKLFEYMAAARPFLASDFPMWRELLGEYGCGVFVDPTDPAAISEALDRLIEDPRRAEDVGLRGRRAFEDHFTFESQISALVRLTERVSSS